MLRLLALTSVVFLAGVANFAAAQDGKKVTMTGKLETGIAAIGGETTGVIIETKDGMFELALGKAPGLAQKAEQLNGKRVVVEGTLNIRKGVEIKERKIITVTKLDEAK